MIFSISLKNIFSFPVFQLPLAIEILILFFMHCHYFLLYQPPRSFRYIFLIFFQISTKCIFSYKNSSSFNPLVQKFGHFFPFSGQLFPVASSYVSQSTQVPNSLTVFTGQRGPLIKSLRILFRLGNFLASKSQSKKSTFVFPPYVLYFNTLYD